MLRFHLLRGLLITAAVCLSCGCASLLASGGAAPSPAAATESGAASGAIGNPSMFDYATGSTKLEFLSPASFLADNPWIEARVVHEQCYFKTPDPLFFVPNWNVPKWTYAGRLNKEGFQSLEYRSALTLGLTEGNVQLNTWPLQLVSLSDMPEAFLQQRLPLLGQAKIGASDEKEMVEDNLRKAQQIRDVVDRLQREYNPSRCVPHHANVAER
jgi:hypothetical protein